MSLVVRVCACQRSRAFSCPRDATRIDALLLCADGLAEREGRAGAQVVIVGAWRLGAGSEGQFVLYVFSSDGVRLLLLRLFVHLAAISPSLRVRHCKQPFAGPQNGVFEVVGWCRAALVSRHAGHSREIAALLADAPLSHSSAVILVTTRISVTSSTFTHCCVKVTLAVCKVVVFLTKLFVKVDAPQLANILVFRGSFVVLALLRSFRGDRFVLSELSLFRFLPRNFSFELSVIFFLASPEHVLAEQRHRRIEPRASDVSRLHHVKTHTSYRHRPRRLCTDCQAPHLFIVFKCCEPLQQRGLTRGAGALAWT